MSLRVEGYCGVGGASRDSAGFVAMEEGLISSGGRNLRLPLCFGLRHQGPRLLAGVGAGFPVVLSEVDTEAENAPGQEQK